MVTCIFIKAILFKTISLSPTATPPRLATTALCWLTHFPISVVLDCAIFKVAQNFSSHQIPNQIEALINIQMLQYACYLLS